MLEFDELRKLYEAETGFKLFRDYGELTESDYARRERNEIVRPVVGLFKVMPAQLTPVQGAFIGTVSAEVEILSRPDDASLAAVRDKLNETAERLNGTTGTVGGYTYTCSIETCTVGAEVRDNYMDCVVPVYQSITYSIVEGGVSSYSVKVTVDGFPVPALSVVQTRTAASSVYTGADMVGRVGVQSESFGLDITVPWLTGGIVDVLRRECTRGAKNKAHAVAVDNNGETAACLMVCGHIVTTAQPPMNVGVTLSMVEASPDAVTVPAWWQSFTADEEVVTANTESKTATVLWGDGSGEVVSGYTWHRYTDGEAKHTGLVVWHTDSPDFQPVTVGAELGTRLRFSKAVKVSSLTGNDLTKTESGELLVSGSRLFMTNGVKTVPVDKYDTESGEYVTTPGKAFPNIMTGKVLQAGTLLEYDRNE